MSLSVFDIFKVGIGPSSSHTMGPMRAAREFALGLKRDGLIPATREIAVRLYGSLALTGVGHGTDRAVQRAIEAHGDRKSTRLNSSHVRISYAVFCLKKKKTASEPLT